MKNKYKYKYLIIIFVLLLILLLLIKYKFTNIQLFEGFSNKVELHNWWEDPKIERIKSIFNEIFHDITPKQVKMYSLFGEPKPNFEKNDNSIIVQYSGESHYNNSDLFHINFIPTNEKKKNIIIFPHAYFHILLNNLDINKLLVKREYRQNQHTKFCLFAVSNGGCQERNQMFTELSKYKNVDSCGKFMNNMNETCPDNHDSSNFYDYISKYKFMICFENKSKPNYFTEKLINAYYNGTIPIYWGCSTISDYVNIDSILYLPPNYSKTDFDRLIQKIVYLDNNQEAYKNMYESIFFKDGRQPDEFNIKKIKEKVKAAL